MTPNDFTSKYKKRLILQKAMLVTRASMLLSANRSMAGLQGVNRSAPVTPTTTSQVLAQDTVVKSKPAAGKLFKLGVIVAETDCVAVDNAALRRLRLSRTTQKVALIVSIWNKRANSTVNTPKNSSRYVSKAYSR